MNGTPPPIHPLGDQALTVVLADEISDEAQTRVAAALRRLRDRPPEGVTELVPAYTTIGVWYDPARQDPGTLADQIRAALMDLAAEADEPAGHEWVIPVRYDGPDLDAIAATLGLTADEVIARHAGRTYRVRFLGFVPGFAFLGGLDPALALPRRSSPRRRVPAGSVAIAGEQTAVYPLDTPGGWHLIGRTELRLFDPERVPPALLQPGDTVRFERQA